MLQKHPLALFIVCSLVTGCAVGPNYTRPHSLVPANFQSEAAKHDSQEASHRELTEWWASFNDPELTKLVTAALEQNLDLAQASARVAQAGAGLGAANAALLPAGYVSGQTTQAYQSLETPLGQVLSSTPDFNRHSTASEANLTAGWELDLFGGLRRGREAAVAEYQASKAGVTATRLTVAAQTADIYMAMRGLQARLDIARRQVHTQQELLAKINLLYEKGLAAEFQVQQVEGALAQVQAAVPVLETGLDTAMNAMDVMLGTSPGAHRAELTEIHPIPSLPKITEMGTPEDLLRRRPDLIVAERRLAASNARIGVAISEYYPKLSLSGLIGTSSVVSNDNLFTSPTNQSAGVVGLRWRLFDFGRINAQINLAKGQESEMLAAYKLAALRAVEDVENAFSALVKREEQASILAKGVDSLSRARDASLLAYQKGIASQIEVLNADAVLLQSTDLQIQAQTESARAVVATYKALGGGWQPSKEQIND